MSVEQCHLTLRLQIPKINAALGVFASGGQQTAIGVPGDTAAGSAQVQLKVHGSAAAIANLQYFPAIDPTRQSQTAAVRGKGDPTPGRRPDERPRADLAAVYLEQVQTFRRQVS